GATEQGLRLGMLTLVVQAQGQVAVSGGGVGVLLAQHVTAEGQELLLEPQRLGVAALFPQLLCLLCTPERLPPRRTPYGWQRRHLPQRFEVPAERDRFGMLAALHAPAQGQQLLAGLQRPA